MRAWGVIPGPSPYGYRQAGRGGVPELSRMWRFVRRALRLW